ncbi:MAG: SDR family oxidoreductase [Polyangiaceae bacterium]|nr:SDR family oxidoreductase [Polyangiaceae bacterium]
MGSLASEGFQEATLVLGGPGELAFSLTEHLLSFRPRMDVYLLVPSGGGASGEEAQGVLARHKGRVHVIECELEALDFGLSGAKYVDLLGKIRWVHHTAGLSEWSHGQSSVRAGEQRERLVGSMREVLAFCRAAAGLEKLVVYSSLAVSGQHAGEFREDDLHVGQKFSSECEEGLAVAEQMARAESSSLPITTLRAAAIVSDIHLDPPLAWGPVLDGWFDLLASRSALHVPPHVRGDELLYLTPLEYVVRAGVFLSGARAAAGQTVHLVEESAPTVRDVLGKVAEVIGRVPPVFGATPGNWLSTPRFGRAGRRERAFWSQLRLGLRYGTTNAARFLSAAGLACPSISSWLVPSVERLRLGDELPAGPGRTNA